MSTSLLVRLANIFVVGYAADAVVSLIALVVGEATLVLLLQRSLASLVYLGAFVCIPMLAFCARLPAPLLLTLCMSVFWLASGGAPLPLAFDPDTTLPAVLALFQSAFALAALLRIRQLNRGRGWLIGDETRPGPAFSFAHTVRFLATLVFIVAPLFLGYVLISVGTWIEVGTERFIRVDLSGIQLSDRRYTRGEREIRLVGMMHLGEDATYRDLAASFVAENTVVLEEGVSDETGKFGRAISYDRLARSLGLHAQRSFGDYLSSQPGDEETTAWPVIRNADVDAQAFSPETLAYLELAARIWDSDEPLAAFLELYRDTLEHPDRTKLLLHDVIELRNRQLIDEIERALPIYDRIIVPWGALHLPEIEREMLARGFVLENETRRQVIAWETLLHAIF
ncbi:MAG: hypothetical protein JRG89_15310 [Deltaproteobacteria bacterium]|nr:hypothetical protein [Deltaproteobacteria bacterium]MBW2389783.1 hypothetical protein [Deltaproteobacteria bacterium]